MGKREGEKRIKKLKHHRQHHKKPAVMPELQAQLEPEPETELEPEPPQPQEEQQMEVVPPAVEHEEEIACDDVIDVMDVVEQQRVENDSDVVTSSPSVSIPTATTLTPASTPTPTTALLTTATTTSIPTSEPNISPSSKPSTSKNALGTASKKSKQNPTGTAAPSKKGKKRRDSGTSSEEERWLTAIESGKLEMDAVLKKMKDPKLMTARQRAMYDRNNDESTPCGEPLLSLPIGYREKEKPQTAEEIQKAALKSLRRKQMADAKREKDKKKTMERLLKKQESKQRSSGRSKVTKVIQPMITYKNTLSGSYVQMPPDHEFPLQAQTAREPPKVQLCGIAGCGNPKVYNCSKTNLPLCSFACYRKNVQAIRQIMC